MYLLKNVNFKKLILLIANFYFYLYFDYRFLILLIIATLVTFFVGNWIYRFQSRIYKKILLIAGISINTIILLFFKYYNFFVDSFNHILASNQNSLQTINIILPLGVSFYTFRFISFLVDVYKNGDDISMVHAVDFIIYGTFFPIIVSGPISRAKFFLPQLRSFKSSLNCLYRGYRLFVIGLFLKVFVADRIAPYVNYFYENHEVFNCISAWLATTAYSIQIYCDFAGYSSMAIGVALMLGLNIERNFNFPYISTNISDFWRRWHITLSYWIKDYLYIPLGGNRKGKLRKYVNLLIAMTLCGLWHGPAWTFVLWGVLHGILLVINHYWKEFGVPSFNINFSLFYSFASWLLTFLTVSFCWIFFRSEGIGQAIEIIQKLFSFNSIGVSWYQPFVIFIILSTVLFHVLYLTKLKIITLPVENKMTPAILFCLIWLVIVFYPQEFQPFVYVQF